MNTTMKPALYVGLRETSRNYQYARPVPPAFQGLTDPLTNKPFGKYVRQSLKTADLLPANVAANALTVQYDAIFHPDLANLSLVARQLYARILNNDEQRRLQGHPVSSTDKMMADTYRRAIALSDHHLEIAADTGYFQATGVNIPQQAPPTIPDDVLDNTPAMLMQRREIGLVLAKAGNKAYRDIERRNQGDYIDTPVDDLHLVDRPRITLDHVREKYLAENNKLSLDSIKGYERTVKRFHEANKGQIELGAITKQHAVIYKDYLVAQGLSAKTINETLLSWIRTLYRYAQNNDLVSDNKKNPFDGVRVASSGTTSKKRIPFDDDDLNVIFNQPEFATRKFRESSHDNNACYWFPILALLTGLRLEEMAQLRPKDVRADHIKVTPDAGDLKTGSSERIVPLHSELLRLGFLEFAESRSEYDRLFELEPDSKGVISGNWSKWFGRWNPVTDKRKVFHSFRHTFVRLCDDAGISEQHQWALTGHKDGSVHGEYRNGYSLQVLQKAIDKIVPPPSFENLNRAHC